MSGTTIRVASAVIEKDGTYLITQRREEAILPLLWEFPGGKVELGESDEEALRREMQERLGADVEVVRKLGETHHAYEGYWIVMAMYECRLNRPDLTPKQVKGYRWVRSDEFGNFQFPPADQTTMEKILGLSGKSD